MSKLIIKYASRERPNRMFHVINSILNNIENNEDVILLISLDSDDTSVYNQEVLNKLKEYLSNTNVLVFFSERTTKVNALNRDLNKLENWKKVMFVTDFTEITKKGFDQIILAHNDNIGCYKSCNSNGKEAHTIYTYSKDIWNLSRNIYNPNLISNFINEEIRLRFPKSNFTEYKEVFHKYVHPKWGYYQYDGLLVNNQKSWKEDLQVLESCKK